MATIFTKIIKGEIPCYKIAEDEHYFAFLDIHPVAKGHTLVVPKKEVDYLFDLDEETLAGLLCFAQRVARNMKAKLDCKRVGVAVMGMEVPHAHVHLIPLLSEGDLDFKRPKLELTPDEFQAIQAQLKL